MMFQIYIEALVDISLYEVVSLSESDGAIEGNYTNIFLRRKQMKRKTLSLIISLVLAVSLSACGNNKFPSEDNSEAERIAELERELEELKLEQEKNDNENLDFEQEENQQPANEAESLLKTTIESPETSGVCGANLTWYYQNGVLAITGTGEMTDYSSYNNTPWYDLRDKIGWVIIDEGVTTIGNNAFYGLEILSKVVFPDTVTSIGDYAFNDCSSLKEITFPYLLTDIGNYAFDGCKSVKEISFKGDIPNGLDVRWFSNFKRSGDIGYPEGYEPTEEERLRTIGERFIPMTIYYTSDTFDELINSYPYWNDYGVEWIKQ